MSALIPVSKNYKSPLAILPCRLPSPPTEGPKMSQMEIQWADYSPEYSVHINLTQFSVQNFSQIVTVSVDNSACGADIQFIFTDTQETLSIPAYSPKDIVPVLTNNREFYIKTVGTTTADDITRFSVLNFVPPPIAVPVSLEQNIAVAGGVAWDTSSTQIVAAGENGTLENVFISYAAAATNTGNGVWALVDGDGNIIARGTVEVSSGDKLYMILVELQGIHIRFVDGLTLELTQSAVIGGTVNVNLYYRTI